MVDGNYFYVYFFSLLVWKGYILLKNATLAYAMYVHIMYFDAAFTKIQYVNHGFL